ncbi:MAG: nicotinate-nucleotide adenylyltransferase [Armatimonadota bacterium]|nr:nicotinate-nucleotide adenylyltransferase [Armatimonadota bacterium]
MRLGILGGTFDPIHIGHLRLGIEAIDRLALDRLVFEVAAVSPFKEPRQMTEGEIRAEMVRAAISGIDLAEVGMQELSRGGTSYTVDTLDKYASAAADVTLVLGSDALAAFDRWRDPEGILAKARIAVAGRPGFGVSEAMRHLPAEWMSRIEVFDARPIDLSATEIRQKVRGGKSIRFLTPDPVVQIIEERRLYV